MGKICLHQRQTSDVTIKTQTVIIYVCKPVITRTVGRHEDTLTPLIFLSLESDHAALLGWLGFVKDKL